MRRLFVAVWLPEEVLDRVAALGRPAVSGLRWTDREQWHVTLRFLGPVEEVEAVSAALRPAAAAAAAVTATLGPAVDRFGHRVLHVPVTGLDGIAEAVVRATAHLGKRPEERPFAGHLTLARAAKDAKVDLRAFTGTLIAADWEVESVCLVESRLSPKGARYEVLERFPLVSDRSVRGD